MLTIAAKANPILCQTGSKDNQHSLFALGKSGFPAEMKSHQGYSELSLPTETFPAELTWSAPMPSFCYTKRPKHRFIAQKAEGARIFQENLQKQGPQFLSFLRTEKFNGRGGESVFDPHFPNTSETNFTLHSLLSHPSALFPQPPDPLHSALLHATAPCSQGC